MDQGENSAPDKERIRDVEQQHQDSIEKDSVSTSLNEAQYPSLKIVIPVSLCLYLSIFLVALDRTIIGVAIPAVSSEFHSFGDIAWYEAAFLLTLCVAQLPMGKIFKHFSPKWTLVTMVAIFEAGSLLCAASPSSKAFIVGRAITGIGGAGVSVGALANIADLVPLRKRPKYQGFAGAVFGISSILGPVVGGAFTSNVSWRWCFWINLPIGGVALAGLVLILPAAPVPERLEGTPIDVIKKFDPIGNLLVAPGVVCVLLALQWGGTNYPWNDRRIIALFVAGSVLLIAFAIYQYRAREHALIPGRVIGQRSIASGAIVSFGVGATLILASFYLPIYFQAIRGTSAGTAGVRLLAYFLSTVIFVIGSGIAISKLGYYTPWLISGCAVLIVGTALLTTLKVDTSSGQWVVYLILVGAGIGLSLQQPSNAVQTVLAKSDISTGFAILQFFNGLGGTISVSVGQTVLSNTLASQLAETFPDFDTSAISTTGAADIQKLVPKDKVPLVLTAYNASINNVYSCALATACLAFVAALFMEWKSVRSKSEASGVSEEQNDGQEKPTARGRFARIRDIVFRRGG